MSSRRWPKNVLTALKLVFDDAWGKTSCYALQHQPAELSNADERELLERVLERHVPLCVRIDVWLPSAGSVCTGGPMSNVTEIFVWEIFVTFTITVRYEEVEPHQLSLVAVASPAHSFHHVRSK